MLEAAYTTVRIIQAFPRIELPGTGADVELGLEKQDLTLVVASGEGCEVSLKPL